MQIRLLMSLVTMWMLGLRRCRGNDKTTIKRTGYNKKNEQTGSIILLLQQNRLTVKKMLLKLWRITRN